MGDQREDHVIVAIFLKDRHLVDFVVVRPGFFPTSSKQAFRIELKNGEVGIAVEFHVQGDVIAKYFRAEAQDIKARQKP